MFFVLTTTTHSVCVCVCVCCVLRLFLLFFFFFLFALFSDFFPPGDLHISVVDMLNSTTIFRFRSLALCSSKRVTAAIAQCRFSSGSHDDFKPKLKPQPGVQESDVISVIKKQIADNDVMLYMKVP